MCRRSLTNCFIIFILSLFAATAQAEEESVCAEVKIEIAQELSMERQAFEVTMRGIHCGEFWPSRNWD